MTRREQQVPAEQMGFFASLVYRDYRRLWGTTSGFNAINGLLMDMPWMTAPPLLRGIGLLFVVIMLSSLLIVHLRSIYARGLSLAGG